MHDLAMKESLQGVREPSAARVFKTQEQLREQAVTEAKSWTTSLPQRRAEHRKRCKDSAKHAKRMRTELEALETELTRIA